MEKRQAPTQLYKRILEAVLLTLGLLFAFVITYKAQVEHQLQENVQCTLMSEHKDNAETVMSAEFPVYSQVFYVEAPNLKKIQLQAEGKVLDAETKLHIVLTDVDTGAVYAEITSPIKKLVAQEKQKYIELSCKKKVKDSDGKLLQLTLELQQPGTTSITITTNYKQGLVESVNDNKNNHSNIIYSIEYHNARSLKTLYICLCVALFIFTGMCFYFFRIKCYTLMQVFIPIALVLGGIMNLLIMAHGVPDEPWHLDTAYRCSNYILMKGNPETPGMIYKRHCDVVTSDMLANGLESNSYYQLQDEFFERPTDTELVEVSYMDSGHIVPDLVFIPTAMGIAVGRLLGLSTLVTLSIGRFFNLVVFVLMIWWAMHIIPYGKNMLGMVMLLPIALQQGASASYDPMITGGIILFIALCLKGAEVKLNKWEWLFVAILVLFIAMSKGGVYLPVCLLLFCIRIYDKETVSKKTFFIGVVILVAILVVLGIVVYPTVASILSQPVIEDGDAVIGVSYVLKHPLRVIYMYWNTFVDSGGVHLAGLLGGRLSWLDVKINWIYLIGLLLGLLLLANIEDEKSRFNIKQTCITIVMLVISIVLIMASMLVAFTTVSADSIEGLQGRYYLVLFPCALMLTTNSMVKVKREQISVILMTMMVIEVLIILQTVTQVV